MSNPRIQTRPQRKLLAARKGLAQELATWREDRRLAAMKRQQKARKAAAKSRGSRGVDRVPARLRGLAITVEAHTNSPTRLTADGTVRRGGTPIVSEDRPAGNYTQRRARGQRGKPRPPRRREIRDHYAANREPDSDLAKQRAATRAARAEARAARPAEQADLGVGWRDLQGWVGDELDRRVLTAPLGTPLVGRTGRAG